MFICLYSYTYTNYSIAGQNVPIHVQVRLQIQNLIVLGYIILQKKSQLKDLTRPRRCLRRTRLREEEELSILLGLIDLKVVARVLRMPEVTDQQLHWCEEKMNRVRIDLEGKMQRDPSPLFYPAH